MGNNFETCNLRSYLHMKSFQYPIVNYPFRDVLENLFGCELSDLHKYVGEFDKFDPIRGHFVGALINKIINAKKRAHLIKIYSPIHMPKDA